MKKLRFIASFAVCFLPLCASISPQQQAVITRISDRFLDIAERAALAQLDKLDGKAVVPADGPDAPRIPGPPPNFGP